MQNLGSSNPTLNDVSQLLLQSTCGNNVDSINTQLLMQNQIPTVICETNSPYTEQPGTSNGHESVFGNLVATEKELNKLKQACLYEEPPKKEEPDCFSNLSSPDLRSLMFGSRNENENENGDGDFEGDGKKMEEETIELQPLLENQQQLAQLQRVSFLTLTCGM